MRLSTLVSLAALAGPLAVGAASASASGQEALLNPHTREGCLHCHKGGAGGREPGRTAILPSHEEPHAVVASSCRSCHKEGTQDFWLVILPTRGERPAASAASAAPIAPATSAAEPARPSPAPVPAEATATGGGEGFENTHDRMECAGCHEKPADQLKPGGAPPPRYAAQGVDVFCQSCHSGVIRSHYPRGNVPPPATTCVNCHRVHGRSALFPSLRDDYPQFLTESQNLNPHGGRIFCLVCHPDTPQPGAAVSFRFPGNSLRLCQRCHGGVEHHPLGVKSTTATWKTDFSRFPLENETLTCVTCHKPPECRGAVDRENPRFLRGGPYNSVEEFCQRCHEGKKFSTLNPHDQIDESGELYQRKCLYCHVTQPSTSAPNTDLRYTDTLTALCISCHQIGPHPTQDHLLPMPREMLANLRDYEERRMVRLPLEDEESVTCVTCHNPHERGLLKGGAGVGADEEHRLRLTTFNEQCTPCHGRH